MKDVEFTPSDENDEDEASELIKTAVDSIDYNITVTSVDMDTTVSMYPATSTGKDCVGSVDVSGTGKYTITCDLGGAGGLMNMGYFKVSNDAQITFVIDSITVNGKYDIDISSELTNTREWADGLRNIWNGFSDGDKVYYSDYAEFRYVKANDAIEFFAAENISSGGGGNAPFIEDETWFFANVKGTGRIEVRLDSPTGDVLTSVDFDSADKFVTVKSGAIAPVGGTHDLYFIFSGKDIAFDSWTFSYSDTVRGDVNSDGVFNVADLVAMQEYILGKGSLNNWQAGDLISDGKLNVFDLVQMRKALLN